MTDNRQPDDRQAKVGFVGLGIMGGPMAANILKAGFDLTVYNRTSGKTAPLVEAGAIAAQSPADVAARCDVIVSCVTNSQDVLEVLLDETRGVISGAASGSTVIDCSTVAPEVAHRCAEAFARKGAAFLDAPVSGGDVGARAGTLSIMVGGDRAAFDRAMPVFHAMGKTITYCGPAGSGYVVKLCNQIVGAMHLVAAAEAISLATAAGVDPATMLTAVSSGAAASWMLTNLAPKMVRGDYKPGFFVDYQLKDLRLASEAAHSMRLPLLGAPLAESLFRAASAQGHGREGTQSIMEVFKQMTRQDRECCE